MSSYDTSLSADSNCHKCGKPGHKAKNCTDAKANSVNVKSSNKDIKRNDKSKDEKKTAKEAAGKCPLCKEQNTYLRLKDREEWPSD